MSFSMAHASVFNQPVLNEYDFFGGNYFPQAPSSAISTNFVCKNREIWALQLPSGRQGRLRLQAQRVITQMDSNARGSAPLLVGFLPSGQTQKSLFPLAFEKKLREIASNAGGESSQNEDTKEANTTPSETMDTKAQIITDQESKNNLRIIALGAPAVEIICALGFESNIIARAVWDTWPPAIKKMPHVGDPANPNIELILQLKPDIIFVDGHFSHLEKRLEQCGIQIVSVSAYYAKDLIPSIQKIARILNAERKGLELEKHIIYLRKLISTRIKDIPNENLQKGLSITGHANYFSFSKKSGFSFLEDSGAINIVGDFEHPYPTLSREWLLYSDLDFLHISIDTNAYTPQEMENALKNVWEITRKQGNMSQLNAVKKGNLFILSQELSYGLRSAIGNIYLAKALHPHLFTDINPNAINAEFTKKYFNMEMQGKRIYP